jgi:SEC-C motif-containing protein
MRSRYSAYVLGKTEFLLSTWHISTRPERLDLKDSSAVIWLGLEILKSQKGRIGDDSGMVEFIARYQTPVGTQQLHECSRFVKQAGKWYYLDGEFPANHSGKPGRNNPCPCGSGKKYKRCCGSG